MSFKPSPHHESQAKTSNDVHHELKRTLSVWDLIIYGMIFMVPIAPMAIYGQVVQTANGMVVLTYFIGLVGMIFTAFSYARMSEAFPVGGSAYAYVQRGWNPMVGFMAGWMILLDYILVPALLYLVAASWLTQLVPSIPTTVWIVAFVLFNTAVNFFGVQMTNRANWIMLVIELATFVLFCGAALVYVAGHKDGTSFTMAPVFQKQGFSLSMVGAATSIAVLSFLGFDGISTLSEETKGGRKTVGRATIWALIFVAVLFMILTYLAAVAYPDFRHFPNANVAFYFIAERVGGTWLKMLCLVVTVLASGIANALAAQAAISRLLFSMGRDRVLPPVLAKIHHKFRTPYVSILLVAVVSLIVSSLSSIDALSSLVNFGALTTFMALNISVIIHFFFRKRSGRWFSHLVMPLLGFAVILYVWINFSHTTFYFGISWFVIGLIVLAITTRGFRKSPKVLDIE
ncbi:porin [Alicyclobacillus hesperidum subsp. aegles]|uniref:APC family permease n=1 Tax=Alicyclobacillus hesperidum TaxID=89784 RepID=UPI00072897F9|nr:APC family permease [Alicyclobacillus hesperidum]KRW91517.1 porin [Alicyclobacillus tengchongensis]GLG02344.1 porin [Alicyclobacillus hesperidum subsp. aegles]